MSYRPIVSKIVHADPLADTSVLLARVRRAVRKSDFDELLLAAVKEEQRRGAHLVERQVFDRFTSAPLAMDSFVQEIAQPGAARTVEGMPSALAALLSVSIDVDGLRTTWGDATAEQHRWRAMLLRKQGSDMLRTADWHEAAAATIEANEVTCLHDLASEAA